MAIYANLEISFIIEKGGKIVNTHSETIIAFNREVSLDDFLVRLSDAFIFASEAKALSGKEAEKYMRVVDCWRKEANLPM